MVRDLRFRGAVFDVDGVLVDSPPVLAWREALGVARLGDRDLLVEAGADLVVTTLDDVSLEAVAEGRLEERRAPATRPGSRPLEPVASPAR
jgi:phosphoglycolate phosphatase-like HAD superfamily hydrolase